MISHKIFFCKQFIWYVGYIDKLFEQNQLISSISIQKTIWWCFRCTTSYNWIVSTLMHYHYSIHSNLMHVLYQIFFCGINKLYIWCIQSLSFIKIHLNHGIEYQYKYVHNNIGNPYNIPHPITRSTQRFRYERYTT